MLRNKNIEFWKVRTGKAKLDESKRETTGEVQSRSGAGEVAAASDGTAASAKQTA